VTDPRTSTVERPPVPPTLVLLLSLLAISWAGPLRRYTDAPAFVISFWRLAFSTGLVAVVLTARGEWSHLRRLRPADWGIAAVAGALLAGHFASWFASLELTSVAASVTLVNMQPVFVALISSLALRDHPAPRQWAGIALAVGGATLIGWGDLRGGPDPLLGDLLALVGALFFAVYYILGRRLRGRVEIWPYVGVVYGCAAVVLLLLALLQGAPLVAGHGRIDWLVFLGQALGPMMIGHTGQNWALRYLPAYVVSLFLLGEPIGATLIAWLLPGIAEVPTVQAVLGGALILTGIGLGMRRR